MKLDKQRRLTLPTALVHSIQLTNDKEIRLSVLPDRLLIYHLDSLDLEIEFHDVVRLDEKNRIILSKRILKMFNPSSLSLEFVVSAMQNQLIIRWNKTKEER